MNHFQGLDDQQAHFLGRQADFDERNGAVLLDQRRMQAAGYDNVGPRRFAFDLLNPFQCIKFRPVINGQAEGLPIHAVFHQHAPGAFHHVLPGQQTGNPHAVFLLNRLIIRISPRL